MVAHSRDMEAGTDYPNPAQTDLPRHTGFRTPEEGIKLPVEYALLGENAAFGPVRRTQRRDKASRMTGCHR